MIKFQKLALTHHLNMNAAKKLLNFVRYAQPKRNLVEIANREFLPGSFSETFPKYLNAPREDFPVVVAAEDVGISGSATAQECAKVCKDNFQDTLNKYGAILYRGFPINDHQSFSDFFNGLSKFNSMDYIGGAAPRRAVGKDTYTASDEPPELTIEGHNEMAYMHIWPDVLFFYCDKPAGRGCGGETVIAGVRDILANLDEEMVGRFAKLGIYYNYHWADKNQGKYKSWQEVFQTEDHRDVEKYMESIGTKYKWKEDGSIAFGYQRPAMINFPLTAELLWFNHATRKHASSWKYYHPLWSQFKDLPYDKFPTHTYFGDMSTIPEEYIQHIREVTWNVAVGFQMQQGDVIAIENHLVQHSRLSFTGERKLLAAILQHAT